MAFVWALRGGMKRPVAVGRPYRPGAAAVRGGTGAGRRGGGRGLGDAGVGPRQAPGGVVPVGSSRRQRDGRELVPDRPAARERVAAVAEEARLVGQGIVGRDLDGDARGGEPRGAIAG